MSLPKPADVVLNLEQKISSVLKSEEETLVEHHNYNNQLVLSFVQLVTDVAGEIRKSNQVFAIQSRNENLGNFYHLGDIKNKSSFAILNQKGLEICLQFDRERPFKKRSYYDEEYLNSMLKNYNIFVQLLEGDDLGDRTLIMISYQCKDKTLENIAKKKSYTSTI